MIEYPKELVHRYGAKAGILMYVAQKLPDIPQVAMVVNEPDESIEDFLRRADQVPILWPRLFRSSAVAELAGYEGDFPTREVDSFDNMRPRIINPNYFGPYRTKQSWEEWIRQVVDEVRFSPKWIKEDGRGQELPDEINVIIAEKSPSQYVGTYIKHPNQDDFFLMAMTDTNSVDPERWVNDADRAAFSYSSTEGVKSLEHFSQNRIPLTASLVRDLEEIVLWHDRIAVLQEMDSRWTYQIEFGADPACLYQVRPFKPVRKVGFKVKKSDEFIQPIVIGVTSRKGLEIRVEEYSDNSLRDVTEPDHSNPDNQPSVFYGPLRRAHNAEDLRNRQANIMYDASGLLAHSDIKSIRSTQVSVLFRLLPFGLDIQHGDWVNIVSNGVNVRIKYLTAAQRR